MVDDRADNGPPWTLGAVVVPRFGVVLADVVASLAARVDTGFVAELTHDLFDGGPQVVAAAGRTYRPNAATARAVRLRDGQCRFPHCTRGAERGCDLDHVIPFADGGTTTPGNLQVLCRHHHRAKTFGGFAVAMNDDGVCTWESSTGRRWLTYPGCHTERAAPRFHAA